MEGLLDSNAALRRLKMRHGLHVSRNVNVSSYILLCKLRRAIQEEFTDRIHRETRKTRRSSRNDKINIFLNRMERLPGATIKNLFKTYETKGIRALVTELNLPIATLLKMSRGLETV
jgi:hypothetical protein